MVARYVVSPHGGRRAHRDITSALAEAARRGRAALIEIEPGHYEEALTVRGDVRLVAVGGPVRSWWHGPGAPSWTPSRRRSSRASYWSAGTPTWWAATRGR